MNVHLNIIFNSKKVNYMTERETNLINQRMKEEYENGNITMSQAWYIAKVLRLKTEYTEILRKLSTLFKSDSLYKEDKRYLKRRLAHISGEIRFINNKYLKGIDYMSWKNKE